MDRHRIDSGASQLLKNMTPVLVPNATVPYDRLVRHFTERTVTRDRELYTMVLRKSSEGRGEVDALSFSD
jgi:hypothetical protein